MSRTVAFKLRGEALQAALQFSDALQLPLNLVAERALLWAIMQAYKKEDQSSAISGTANTAATAGQVPPSGDPPTAPLAESEVLLGSSGGS